MLALSKFDVSTVGKDIDFDGVLPLRNKDIDAGLVKVRVKWYNNSKEILESKGVKSVTSMKL